MVLTRHVARFLWWTSCFRFLTVSAQPNGHTHRTFADRWQVSLYNNTLIRNECTSSLGVSMMFALLYPAASAGATRTQLEGLFGYHSDTAELPWLATQRSLNDHYDGRCLEDECLPIVSVSNAVWVDNDPMAVLDSDYAAILGEDLLRTLDMTATNAGRMVNEWVRMVTRNLISEIVEDGPLSPTVLLAVNAIYLKADFAQPFFTLYTNQDNFYGADGSTVTSETTLFMHQVEFFNYSDTAIDQHQVIDMPFVGHTLRLLLALPTTPDAEMVDSAALLEALPALTRQRVAIGVPKWELERTYDNDILQQSLRDLGLMNIFEAGALCIFENDCSAFVSLIVQKTFFSVNEGGVEAAAVTMGMVNRQFTETPRDIPVLFLANRPFQFWIYDSLNDVVLFEGRVVHPETSDTTARHNGTHAQADFWPNLFGVEPRLVSETLPPTILGPTVSPPTTLPTVSPTSPAAASPTVSPIPTRTPTLSPTSGGSTPSNAPFASSEGPQIHGCGGCGLAILSLVLLQLLF